MKKENMLTIKDIALKAKVAKSTVSRFLNGGSVSSQTAKKIKKIIDETGYVPNVFAKSLKAKKTGLIGVMIPRLGSAATDTVVQALDRQLRGTDNRLLIVNTDQDIEREIEALVTLASQKVDYIVFLATQLNEQHYEIIDQLGVNVIVVGQKSEKLLSVSYDDYMAGKLIGEHILSGNIDRVLFIGVSKMDKAIGIDRQSGLLDKLAENTQITVECVESTFQLFDAYVLAKEILPDERTYLAAATDTIAVGFLKAIYEKNLRVPHDFLLSGFGGYDSAHAVHPALTTVSYPYAKAGKYIADIILGNESESIVLPVQLTVQQSTFS